MAGSLLSWVKASDSLREDERYVPQTYKPCPPAASIPSDGSPPLVDSGGSPGWIPATRVRTSSGS
ncbi:hypothetical protein GCM10007285_20340 [Stappia taiwanensis]|nr:hypothetical protein GCM10007285_20340 [Stappia taiwanensis]